MAAVSGSTALVYNTDSFNPKPIVEVTYASDPNGTVPTSIQAQLTWNNGTPQTAVTFSTTGHSAGDVYLLDLQDSSAVTFTSAFPWSVTVTAAYSGGINVVRTVSGKTPVIVNGSASPYGPGWSLASVDQLVTVGSDLMWVHGGGEARYFQSLGNNAYLSPPNDFGTLVKNIDGSYTYTAKDQTKFNFDSSGNISTVVDPHNLTLTYAYSSGLLSTISEPDGGVGTFAYTSGLLTKVTEPGGRVVTLTYASGYLSTLQDPDGSLESFGYDASNRLNNDQHGPLNATITYDTTSGEPNNINLGLSDTLAIAPANSVGLATSPAKNASAAVGVLTDGLSHPTTYTLDGMARTTKLQTADGAVQSWQRDFAGQATTYTDPLNHVTTSTFDYNTGKGDLTQVTNADGSIGTFQYDGTFHHMTVSIDGNGNRTTMAYDATTGDLTTLTNALNQTTTYAYLQTGGRSNGLLQSTTDALGNVASYAYDSNRRETTVVEGYGTAVATTATMIYDTAGNLSSETSGISSTVAYDHHTTTSHAYDGMRRETQLIEAFGTTLQRTTTTLYDAIGDVLSVTDPAGHIVSYAYDQVGRKTTEIDGYGTAVATTGTMIYDNAGNLLSQTTGSSTTTSYDHHTTTSYGYDAVNRQNQVIQGYGTSVAVTGTMIYDTAGNLVSETQGISATASYDHHTTTSFGYDVMNRQNQVIAGYGTSSAVTATMIYDLAGNLLSQTDHISATASYDHHATTSYTFDALERQIAVTEGYGTSLARTSTTTFDTDGNTLSTTDPSGHLTSYAYNQLNQQTKVISAYGTSVAVTGTMIYDAADNLQSETTGQSTTSSYDHSVTTSYGYDSLNRQTQRIDAYGTSVAVTATMIYDVASNLLSETTGISSTTSYDHHTTTSFGYDALDRKTTEILGYSTAVAVTATMIYDAANNLLSRTTGQSTTSTYAQVTTTSYAYDALNRETQVIEAYGVTGLQRTTTTVLDASSNTLSITDPLSHITSFAYNALNQRTQEIDAFGSSVAVTGTMIYDAAGNLQSETTGQSATLGYDHSVTTSFGYDSLNRQTQRIDAYGTSIAVTATMSYDVASNLLSETTGISSTTSYDHHTTTSYGYDALNRKTTEIDAYGVTGVQRTVTTVFDAASNVQARIDALANATTSTYDALNRETQVQTPAGYATTVYDAASNVVNTIDANSNKSTFAYDSLNRQTAATDPRGGITTSVFDAASNKVNLIDSDGNKTTFSFDTVNRLTQQTDPLGKSATFAYSATDLLTSTTDRDSRVDTFSYDALDREIGATWKNSTGSTVNTLTYTLDAAGERLTAADTNGAYTMAYDQLNRMTSEQEPYGQALTFTFDAASNRITRTDSQSGVATETYDALNRLVSYQYAVNGVATLSLYQTWTKRDQLATQSRYSDLTGTNLVGTTSYGYDNAARETNLQFKDGSGNNISNFTYNYDPGNRLTAETLALATLSASTTSYQYDSANQLTNSGALTYGYDLNGNRTNTGYTTGTGNQLTNDGTWTYTYDSEGSLTKKSKGSLLETWTYGYDNLNHLAWAEDRQTDGGTLIQRLDFKYDVFGNRIDKELTINSTTTATHFANDGPNAWADLSSANALQTRRLYMDAVDALFARISSGGTAAWYLTDRLGSVRDIANNTTGASIDHLDYDGFGNASETQSGNGDRFKFTGGEWDTETKLQRNGWRYFDPLSGRWISEDPIGFRAADQNLYRYVRNDPVNKTDPTGLYELKLKGTRTDFEGNIIDSHFDVGSSEDKRIKVNTGKTVIEGRLWAYERADNESRGDGGKGGFLLRYVDDGANADKVKFMQFVRLSIRVEEQLQKWDKKTQCVDDVFVKERYLTPLLPHNPEHIAEMQASTANQPVYYFDIKKDAKDPFYPGEGGLDSERRTSWLWDAPGYARKVAEEYGIPFLKRSTDPAGIGLRPWPAGNATYTVTQHFVTYVIAGGKAAALVEWETSAVASVSGRVMGNEKLNKPKFETSKERTKLLHVWTLDEREAFRKEFDGIFSLGPLPDLSQMLKDRFGKDQTFVTP
jgi:RHS repeat-associated protein